MEKLKNIFASVKHKMWKRAKDSNSYRFKTVYLFIYSLFVPKYKYNTATPSIISGHNKRDVLKSLREDGIYNFGKVFTDAEVQNIIDKLKDKRCYYGYNPTVSPFYKSEAPTDVNTANYFADDYMGEELFLRLLYDEKLLDIFQDFFGCQPVIYDVSLYWSLLGRATSKDAQVYHRDGGDVKLLAIALYLTDVNSQDDGAYCYMKKSATSNKILEHSKRHTDEEIHKTFGKENEVVVTGPRGTLVVTDNLGFHRGSLPTQNERFIFFGHIGVSKPYRVLNPYQYITSPENIRKLKNIQHLAETVAFDYKES